MNSIKNSQIVKSEKVRSNGDRTPVKKKKTTFKQWDSIKKKEFSPFIFLKIRERMKERLKHIRETSIVLRHSELNSAQLHVLNDRAFYPKEKIKLAVNVYNHTLKPILETKAMKKIEDSRFIRILLEKTSEILDKSKVVIKERVKLYHPAGRKLYWDFFITLITLLCLFTFSLSISFRKKTEEILEDFFWTGSSAIFKYLLIFSFTIDIMIKFNTCYFESGELILNRRKIILNYFRKEMWFDVIALVPLYLNLSLNFEDNRTVSQVTKLLFFIKVKEVLRSLFNLEILLESKQNLKGIELIILILKILSLTHISGCFWHLIGDYADPDENSWIKVKNLENKPWTIRYVYSLYWSLTTTLTVGYGDITPQNQSEIMYCMLAMLMGCAVFGYSINQIGLFLQEMNKNSSELKRQMKIANQYMSKFKIDFSLKMRIRRFLEYAIKEKTKKFSQDEEQVLGKLNQELLDELVLQAYGNVVSSFPPIKENFTPESIMKMAKVTKLVYFRPRDVIIQHPKETALYKIAKGTVSVRANTVSSSNPHEDEKILRIFKRGDWFGANEFFLDKQLNIQYECMEKTTVYKIAKADFVKILEENEEDYHKYCEIRDKLVLYNDFKSISLSCYSCGKIGHIIENCPQLHYLPNTMPIILKHNFSPKQVRCRKERDKFRKRIRTLLHHHDISASILDYKNRFLETGTLTYDEEDMTEMTESIEISNTGRETKENEIELNSQDNPNALLDSPLLADVEGVPVLPSNKTNPNPFEQIKKKKNSSIFAPRVSWGGESTHYIAKAINKPRFSMSTNRDVLTPLIFMKEPKEVLDKEDRGKLIENLRAMSPRRRSNLKRESLKDGFVARRASKVPTNISEDQPVSPSKIRRNIEINIPFLNSVDKASISLTKIAEEPEERQFTKLGTLISHTPNERCMGESLAFFNDNPNLYFYDMDSVASFKNYFPHNNVVVVLGTIENMSRSKRRRAAARKTKLKSRIQSSNHSHGNKIDIFKSHFTFKSGTDNKFISS